MIASNMRRVYPRRTHWLVRVLGQVRTYPEPIGLNAYLPCSAAAELAARTRCLDTSTGQSAWPPRVVAPPHSWLFCYALDCAYEMGVGPGPGPRIW